jgi:hypothetical protein
MYILHAYQTRNYTTSTIIGVSANLERLAELKEKYKSEGYTTTDLDGEPMSYDNFWISEAPAL